MLFQISRGGILIDQIMSPWIRLKWWLPSKRRMKQKKDWRKCWMRKMTKLLKERQIRKVGVWLSSIMHLSYHRKMLWSWNNTMRRRMGKEIYKSRSKILRKRRTDHQKFITRCMIPKKRRRTGQDKLRSQIVRRFNSLYPNPIRLLSSLSLFYKPLSWVSLSPIPSWSTSRTPTIGFTVAISCNLSSREKINLGWTPFRILIKNLLENLSWSIWKLVQSN